MNLSQTVPKNVAQTEIAKDRTCARMDWAAIGIEFDSPVFEAKTVDTQYASCFGHKRIMYEKIHLT